MIALGDDVWAVWDHPDAPMQLKKRILRTMLSEIVVDSQRDSPTHRLILHWAGGVHTELYVERNLPGRHRHSAERTVIDLVSELAKVCPDKDIAAILNRLGYKMDKRRIGTHIVSRDYGGIRNRAVSETRRLGDTVASGTGTEGK